MLSVKKKLLIISVSAGAGHMRAAEGIAKTAKKQYADTFAVEHIDMMKYVSRPLRAVFVDTYEHMVHHVPSLWKFIYDTSNHKERLQFLSYFTRLISQIQSKKFFSFINSYHPDSIICTHPFPAQVIRQSWGEAYLKQVPLSLVMTDYDLHSFWLSVPADRFFVATEKMKNDIRMRGVGEEYVVVVGAVPVDPVFFEDKNVDELKRTYHIDNEERVILVLAGGQGLIESDKLVKRICLFLEGNGWPVHIIAVAGRNTSLLERLSRLNNQMPQAVRLSPVGWTEHIDEYMRIADVVITKSGGVTTSECLALHKPMIITNTILGQEEKNAQYVVSEGKGYIAQTSEELRVYTERVLSERKKEPKKKRHLKNPSIIILEEIKKSLEKTL